MSFVSSSMPSIFDSIRPTACASALTSWYICAGEMYTPGSCGVTTYTPRPGSTRSGSRFGTA